MLKLMYTAIIRAAARWRGITVGEFEHRQLRALRDELITRNAQPVAPTVAAKPTSPVRTLNRPVQLDTACIAGSIIQQRWDLTGLLG